MYLYTGKFSYRTAQGPTNAESHSVVEIKKLSDFPNLDPCTYHKVKF